MLFTNFFFNSNSHKFRCEKLEKIFSEKTTFNHNLYDSYFEKKLNLNSLDLFKDHYSNFKPVLDQIKSFNVASLTDVTKLTRFANSDLQSLTTKPFTNEIRQQFFKKPFVEPTYPNTSRINDYREIFNNFQDYTNSLETFTQYLCDPANELVIDLYVLSSRGFINGICAHPDYRALKTLMASLIQNLREKDIEVLRYYCDFHEAFVLTTFEPYMLSVLGFSLFLKFYLPLHRPGALKHLMGDAISLKPKSEDTFFKKIDFALDRLDRFSRICQPFLARVSGPIAVAMSISSALKNFTKKPLQIEQAVEKPEDSVVITTVTDTVKATILAGQGYENTFVNITIDHVNRIAFTIGQTMGSFTRSLIQGFASKHNDVIIAGSEAIDRHLTNKAAQLEDQKSKVNEVESNSKKD